MFCRGADGEEPLTLDELVGFCILLLIAGNETTTNLVGNWTRMLLDRPDVEAALRDGSIFVVRLPWDDGRGEQRSAS